MNNRLQDNDTKLTPMFPDEEALTVQALIPYRSIKYIA